MAVSPLNDSYAKYGKNKGGLVVLAISGTLGDTKSKVADYKKANGINYPLISGDELGGGYKTAELFTTISAWPTIVIIEPTGKIVKNFIWPPADIPSILDGYGISTSILSKSSSVNKDKAIAINAVNSKSLSFYAPEAGFYTISAYGANGQLIQSMNRQVFTQGVKSLTWSSDFNSNSVYFVKVSTGDSQSVKRVRF